MKTCLIFNEVLHWQRVSPPPQRPPDPERSSAGPRL